MRAACAPLAAAECCECGEFLLCSSAGSWSLTGSPSSCTKASAAGSRQPGSTLLGAAAPSGQGGRPGVSWCGVQMAGDQAACAASARQVMAEPRQPCLGESGPRGPRPGNPLPRRESQEKEAERQERSPDRETDRGEWQASVTFTRVARVEKSKSQQPSEDLESESEGPRGAQGHQGGRADTRSDVSCAEL